jgi:hypothetical protein
MSSGNQNCRFYLTSSLLGNWDSLEITVTYSSSLHVLRELDLEVFFDLKFAGQLRKAIPSHLHDLREPVLEVELAGQPREALSHCNRFLLP